MIQSQGGLALLPPMLTLKIGGSRFPVTMALPFVSLPTNLGRTKKHPNNFGGHFGVWKLSVKMVPTLLTRSRKFNE